MLILIDGICRTDQYDLQNRKKKVNKDENGDYLNSITNFKYPRDSQQKKVQSEYNNRIYSDCSSKSYVNDQLEKYNNLNKNSAFSTVSAQNIEKNNYRGS